MALLGKIRSLGPVALISVIGLALFAFVFSTGSGTIVDIFNSEKSTIGVINEDEIEWTYKDSLNIYAYTLDRKTLILTQKNITKI